MAEYIEKETARAELIINDELYAADIVKAIPAADVAEVRHGRWSMTKDGAAYCSACKRKMNPYLYGYAHCAMCGARMDGGVNRVDFDTVKNGGVNDG